MDKVIGEHRTRKCECVQSTLCHNSFGNTFKNTHLSQSWRDARSMNRPTSVLKITKKLRNGVGDIPRLQYNNALDAICTNPRELQEPDKKTSKLMCPENASPAPQSFHLLPLPSSLNNQHSNTIPMARCHTVSLLANFNPKFQKLTLQST